jgi:trimeric autotransporter adhesin
MNLSVEKLLLATLVAVSATMPVMAAAQTVAATTATQATTCPFDDGNSSLAVEGVVLTRYALGITGAPLVANTGINAVDAPTVEASINCPSCGLNITGNPTMTVPDATIISRKLAGFTGPALTNGVALGSGTRNTPAAVQSFLLAGCGATGGTVTSVTAGTGLAGGPITTTGALNIASSYQLPQSCANGQVPKSNGAGGWACAADLTGTSGGSGTVTSVATGAGLTGGPITGAGTIGLAASQLLPTTTCGDSQTLIWNSTGSNWICAAWAPPGAGAANAFVNGGNAFTSPAVLGTSNGQPLSVGIGGGNGLRILPSSQAGEPVLISGSAANFVTGAATFSEGATISGGGSPLSNCGAANNLPCANSAAGRYSTVGGGLYNRTGGQSATVAGGSTNNASAFDATVGGGGVNTASGTASTVAGGSINAASGTHSAVPGGRNNIASGVASFAAGNYASAVHDNAFVWNGRATVKSSGDDGTVQFASPSYIELDARSSATSGAFLTVHGALSGGVVAMGSDTKGVDIYGPGSLSFVDTNERQMLNLHGTEYGIGVKTESMSFRSVKRFCWYLGGTYALDKCDPVVSTDPSFKGPIMKLEYQPTVINGLPSGDTFLTVNGYVRAYSYNTFSDKNGKENFRKVTPRSILAKVSLMPVSQWNFKSDGGKYTHLGPMAQDFRRLFGLGVDEKSISMVDAAGVAFAAIQGLNQVIKEKDAKIEALITRLRAIEKKLGM